MRNSKPCNKCGNTKEFVAFELTRGKNDTRSGTCRECRRSTPSKILAAKKRQATKTALKQEKNAAEILTRSYLLLFDLKECSTCGNYRNINFFIKRQCKDCINAKRCFNKGKNEEHYRDKAKRYYVTNKDRIDDRNKEYYQNNRNHCMLLSKERTKKERNILSDRYVLTCMRLNIKSLESHKELIELKRVQIKLHRYASKIE